jgi:hypothetical protein
MALRPGHSKLCPEHFPSDEEGPDIRGITQESGPSRLAVTVGFELLSLTAVGEDLPGLALICRGSRMFRTLLADAGCHPDLLKFPSQIRRSSRKFSDARTRAQRARRSSRAFSGAEDFDPAVEDCVKKYISLRGASAAHRSPSRPHLGRPRMEVAARFLARRHKRAAGQGHRHGHPPPHFRHETGEMLHAIST